MKIALQNPLGRCDSFSWNSHATGIAATLNCVWQFTTYYVKRHLLHFSTQRESQAVSCLGMGVQAAAMPTGTAQSDPYSLLLQMPPSIIPLYQLLVKGAKWASSEAKVICSSTLGKCSIDISYTFPTWFSCESKCRYSPQEEFNHPGPFTLWPLLR